MVASLSWFEKSAPQTYPTTPFCQITKLKLCRSSPVLRDFYAKAGDATALLQQPEIFDSPYQGMQAENGGVVGMLEVALEF